MRITAVVLACLAFAGPALAVPPPPPPRPPADARYHTQEELEALAPGEAARRLTAEYAERFVEMQVAGDSADFYGKPRALWTGVCEADWLHVALGWRSAAGSTIAVAPGRRYRVLPAFAVSAPTPLGEALHVVDMGEARAGCDGAAKGAWFDAGSGIDAVTFLKLMQNAALAAARPPFKLGCRDKGGCAAAPRDLLTEIALTDLARVTRYDCYQQEDHTCWSALFQRDGRSWYVEMDTVYPQSFSWVLPSIIELKVVRFPAG